MRVSALKSMLPKVAMSSPYLCDEYLTALHFPPRGPLEPWCASVSDHLQEAIQDRHAHIDEIAGGFEQAAEIALLLGRLGEAKKLRLAAIGYFMTEVDADSGTFAIMPALWMALGLARIERALGHYDDALFAFECIASLGLGGSLDDGPLILSPTQVSEMESNFPESSARLRSVAIAEALETLVRAGHYDLAITAARARRADDPTWLGAFRCETIATALGRLGLVRETIVYLASVIAQRPEYPRLAFEQKRAEALAADGRFEEASACLAFIVETFDKQWTTTPPTLSDVALAARTSLLLSILGRHAESACLAARAREFARELGDVPLEAELALRVMESDAPSDVRADAADALTHILLATGYAITLPRGGARLFEAAMPPANEPRAPTYPLLRDRLYAIAA
jgi:tetratricopeptide (TPR) repeat protein